jgi:glycosyltransferase involved in cell wall biosynthesis
MTMQPLVSIVVPVFNGMPHLVDLTQSLLAQTYPHLEIIFTEGGGNDGSRDFLATIKDPRVRIIEMPKGTSAAENWTAATMAAQGEFTKLICQDDLITPDAIAKQVEDLSTHPEAVMAIAKRNIVDAQGNVLYAGRGLAGLPKNQPTISGASLIRTCYLQGTNVIGEPLAVLFRTAALKEAMPWNDANPLMLDLSTYQNVAPHGDVVLRHESLGAFRVSTSSWSTRIVRQQLQQTRDWQHAYADTAQPTPSTVEQMKATINRHKQTTLRRIAYAVLKAKGAFTTEQNRTS